MVYYRCVAARYPKGKSKFPDEEVYTPSLRCIGGKRTSSHSLLSPSIDCQNLIPYLSKYQHRYFCFVLSELGIGFQSLLYIHTSYLSVYIGTQVLK